MAAAFIASSAGETQLNRIVCGIVLKGHWNLLLKPTPGSTLKPSTMEDVISRLSLHCELSWEFYKWMEIIPGYKHSLKSTWCMIQTLTRNKFFITARQLLDKIALRDFLFSPSVLNSVTGPAQNNPDLNSQMLSWLVIRYVESGMMSEAIQVFEHMRVNGLIPHLPACTVLLNSLVKTRLISTVWKLYKKMVRLGVVANLHVYNVLVHACSRAGDVDKADELLGEMESKGISPDLFTYNTLISMYMKKGMHYEAMAVQDRMEQAGIARDIVTYNSLIYGFCKEGRMREALRLFGEIKGTTPNRVTYTTLIDGYCRVNNLDEALRLLRLMDDTEGLFPEVATYNAILRKLCEEGRIRDANRILCEMGEKKVEPDNITCNTLINAYCKNGDLRSALKVKDRMLGSGLKLDSFTYKALIHGFCKLQEMESAKKLLLEMLNARLTPTYCTFSWVVDGYCNQGNEDAVLRMPDELARKGFSLDISVYRALLRRLCKREKVDHARNMFSLMQDAGIQGDTVVFTSLAFALFRQGNLTSASILLDEMYKRRFSVTLKIYRSFCASYAQNSHVLNIFWDQLGQRGLLSNTICMHMKMQSIS